MYILSFSFQYLPKLASKEHQEALDEDGNCKRGGDESDKLEFQWMTFPINKRINTELFVDRNKGLYIQKADQEKYLTS